MDVLEVSQAEYCYTLFSSILLNIYCLQRQPSPSDPNLLFVTSSGQNSSILLTKMILCITLEGHYS